MGSRADLSEIALPSLVGKTLGKDLFGEPYIVYPWVEYVERRVVEACLDRGGERYIIVNLPPQVGKTSYVGVLLSFWLTGMFPDLRLMYLSYSDDFSVSKGKEVRNLHRSYGERLFGTSIDPDFDKAAEWRLSGHWGGMLSVGIGGLITGKPGDVIIIDDLIKGLEDATSVATKRKHLGEWDATIHSRLQPGGTVIVVSTRWAEDDLSGSLITRMKEPGYDGPQWEVISLPAFAAIPDDEVSSLTVEERAAWRDCLGRLEGEVLDCRFSRLPGRAPDDYFRLKRNSTDPFVWSCLWQQSPFTAEGSMFPREAWRTYRRDELPEMDMVWRVWDLAGTEGGGDWTVGTKIGKADDKFYVLDVQRFRKAADGVLTAIVDTAPIDTHHTAIGIEEEKGGAGKSTVAALARMLPEYRVEPMKAEGDKKSRATPWSAVQRGGRAHLPEEDEATWDVRAYKDEHVKMMQDGRLPRHDDQIDTSAYAVLQMVGSSPTELFVANSDSHSLSPEAMMRLLEMQVVEAGGGWN